MGPDDMYDSRCVRVLGLDSLKAARNLLLALKWPTSQIVGDNVDVRQTVCQRFAEPGGGRTFRCTQPPPPPPPLVLSDPCLTERQGPRFSAMVYRSPCGGAGTPLPHCQFASYSQDPLMHRCHGSAMCAVPTPLAFVPLISSAGPSVTTIFEKMYSTVAVGTAADL